MAFAATTITEHIQNESRIKGKIKGKIELLEDLYSQGILTKELFEEMVKPLRYELNEFLPGFEE
ncbi:MAG: hypothetical protein GY795_02735 [Desulfobacterales bacterium]|nr:hypothetical protein [Desulfobacterales bacterium]